MSNQISNIDLKIPDVGGGSKVTVAEIYIKIGDVVNKDDNLIMLETDKATMEVPTEFSGTIKEILIKVGDGVQEGDIIARLDYKTQSSNLNETKPEPLTISKAIPITPTPIITPPINDVSPSSTIPNHTPSDIEIETAYASPSIRKLARELGISLKEINGTGARGRILEEDVKNYVKSNINISSTSNNSNTSNNNGLSLLPWPNVDFKKAGEIEITPLSKIKKISGANLLRNWVMIPHVTQFDEADITELESFRKKTNEDKNTTIKVTPLAFLVMACIRALKEFPEFNSSIVGDNLIYKKYYNIGFAADTPNGLVVPVLKNADKKGLLEIANNTSELAKLAREGKLKPQDMQDGTFTISSLGGIGGTAFTPIINAPEVAILGVSKSTMKPVWNGKEFAPKLMLPLCLSYDHRIIDGALAAKFTVYLSRLLSDIRTLIL